MSSLAILLVCIFCVLHLYCSGVTTLECYSCSSCNDPFKSSGVSTKTCAESCMKTKGEENGTHFVNRSCGKGSTEKCEKEKYKSVDVNVCMCTGNLCNGADDIKIRLTLPIICTAIFAIARKLIM